MAVRAGDAQDRRIVGRDEGAGVDERLIRDVPALAACDGATGRGGSLGERGHRRAVSRCRLLKGWAGQRFGARSEARPASGGRAPVTRRHGEPAHAEVREEDCAARIRGAEGERGSDLGRSVQMRWHRGVGGVPLGVPGCGWVHEHREVCGGRAVCCRWRERHLEVG